MAKLKTTAGSGYLGEIMVHKITRSVGVVDAVVEAQAGWPPQITLKLKDGSLRKGKLSDFKEARAKEKQEFSTFLESQSPPAPKPEIVAASPKGKTKPKDKG